MTKAELIAGIVEKLRGPERKSPGRKDVNLRGV